MQDIARLCHGGERLRAMASLPPDRRVHSSASEDPDPFGAAGSSLVVVGSVPVPTEALVSVPELGSVRPIRRAGVVHDYCPFQVHVTVCSSPHLQGSWFCLSLLHFSGATLTVLVSWLSVSVIFFSQQLHKVPSNSLGTVWGFLPACLCHLAEFSPSRSCAALHFWLGQNLKDFRNFMMWELRQVVPV